jgi:hypothetical protein
MEGRHLTKRAGFVFTLVLAALSLGLAPGIAIADGVSTSSIETLGDTTQAVSDTTQAVSDTTQAGTEAVADATSGAGSNLNAAGAVVDKNASLTVSPGLVTGSTVQADASGAQGGATTTGPESTTAYGDPVASSADPRLVWSRDPMRIDWSSSYSATGGSGSSNACPRVGAMCTAEASSSPPGSLGEAVVLAIRWLATTGLDILFKLVLAFGLALAGALAFEAARRQQTPQVG